LLSCLIFTIKQICSQRKWNWESGSDFFSLSRSAQSLALPQSAPTSAFGVTWALRTRDLFKLPLLLFLLSFCFSFVIHSTEFNRGI